MAEIINFRPTPDVAQMIESQKAKGVNISRWINNLLIGADKQADSLNLQIYTIPEDGINLYDSTKLAIDQMISLHSIPFSRLSISRYREANDIIKQAEIINFRPTPDVAQMIESQKAKGVNISRWINNLLIGADKQADSLNLQIYTIPEDGINLYDSTKLAIDQMISLHSLPFSRLSISRYREANDIIKQAGMDYYRFKIDEDNYISIIAVNREEASVEFSRYYMKSENKEYVRTSVPLPVYRFDVKNKVVIIIASE